MTKASVLSIQTIVRQIEYRLQESYLKLLVADLAILLDSGNHLEKKDKRGI